MDSNIKIITFGCKVNVYDSGLLAKNLQDNGFFVQSEEDKQDDPKVIIFNTCAVTAEATLEAQKTIRRIKAKYPMAHIVVTGCGAQVDTGKFDSLKGVDLIVANSHKHELAIILDDYFKGQIKERVFKSNIFRKNDLGRGGGKEAKHTRAFLKIQDGCNSFCSYCIIPYARGTSRSLSQQELIEQVDCLYSEGVREVVITGIHIGDYQDPVLGVNGRLENLMENLLLKTQMPRFRISSLEPPEITPRLLELYQDTRLCPHFHMSIQSAHTNVLKTMKRRYDARAVEKVLNEIALKVPQSFVGMDLIVGFPTETREAYAETKSRLSNLSWNRIHVFPYSERPGTMAAAMTSQVDMNERKRRAHEMRELSTERFSQTALAQIGKIKEVLVLNSKHHLQGLSGDYWTVRFNQSVNGAAPLIQPGKIIPVEVTEFDSSSISSMEGILYGKIRLGDVFL